MVNRDGTRAKGLVSAKNVYPPKFAVEILDPLKRRGGRARRIEFHHEENEESVRCLDDDNRFGRQVFEVSPEKGMRRGITMELKSVKLQIGIRYYDNWISRTYSRVFDPSKRFTFIILEPGDRLLSKVKWIRLLQLPLKLLFLSSFRCLVETGLEFYYLERIQGFSLPLSVSVSLSPLSKDRNSNDVYRETLEICGWNSFRGFRDRERERGGIKYWMRFKETDRYHKFWVLDLTEGESRRGAWFLAWSTDHGLMSLIAARPLRPRSLLPRFPFTPNRQFADPSKAGRPRIARPYRE